MAVIPHFQFPLRIDGSGHIATVEQDSTEDILSCVYVALKTPIGSRPYVPNFGVDDYTFSNAPVQISEIQAQIIASEPRAEIDLSEEISDLVERVVVGVGNVG
jgi:phage baseplate assembly protein W